MTVTERTSGNFNLTVSKYRKHLKMLTQKKAIYVQIYTDFAHSTQVSSMLSSTSGVIFLFEGVVVETSLLKELPVLSWRDFLYEAKKNEEMQLKLYYGDPNSLSVCFAFEFYLDVDNNYQPSFEFECLFKMVPVGFSAYRIEMCGEKTVLIIFSSTTALVRNVWRDKLKKHIIIFLPVIGYGDLTIMLPIFKEYFSNHKDYIITIYSADQKVNTMVNHFFSSYSIKTVSLFFLGYNSSIPATLHYIQLSLLSQCLEQIASSDIYKEVVLLKLDNSQLNMQSAYEIFSRLMNIEPNHALDTFKYNISDIPISKKILKLRKTKRFVIGIQYQSDTVDINGNRVKDWSKENIKLFLEMCKQEQIGVVNLVPITDKDITWDINADQVSIWNLLEIIAAVDCVVCIDSVCGHIAGLVGTNNLLLWSSQSYYQPTIYAYRPLRCNYTIYTSTRLSDIPPKLIFDRLKEILIGKLVLQKERFTMHGIDPNQYAINTEQFCVENEKQEK